jgi:ribosome-associated protein
MGNRHLTDAPIIPSAELLRRVVELCLDRKAEDVVSLDVRELVEYMDNMVIVTGRSPRQNRAIAEHVVTQLKREHRILPLSKAGMDGGSWICVDLVDLVLHVFEPEAREHYDLELLWADAVKTEYEAPKRTADEEAAVDEALAADIEAATSIEDDMIEQSQAKSDDA